MEREAHCLCGLDENDDDIVVVAAVPSIEETAGATDLLSSFFSFDLK